MNLYKVLRDEAFNIARDPKYDRYQRGIALMVYKFFNKSTFGSGIKNEHSKHSDKELAEELHKRIIQKKKKLFFKKKSTFTFYRQYLG